MVDNSINDGNVYPLLVFGGSCCQELTEDICRYMDIEPGKADVRPFPNGETMVRIDKSADVRGRDVFVIVSVCRQSNPNERGYTGINDCLMELLVFGDALRRASAQRITAVIPYFGYARQDRKAAGRTPITARLVADTIALAGYSRVLTLDLHADQIQGFFDRDLPLDHLNAGKLFADHFNLVARAEGWDQDQGEPQVVLLAPDLGNIKKADKYRRGFKFRVGSAFIDKTRNPETGEAEGRRVAGDSVEGKTIIMLDDIVSTAGTMSEAIRLTANEGAKEFYIGASHGELVGPAIERLTHPLIKQICITDSIPILSRMKELPLQVLPVAELFGDALVRIHRYESISELLGIYG